MQWHIPDIIVCETVNAANAQYLLKGL